MPGRGCKVSLERKYQGRWSKNCTIYYRWALCTVSSPVKSRKVEVLLLQQDCQQKPTVSCSCLTQSDIQQLYDLSDNMAVDIKVKASVHFPCLPEIKLKYCYCYYTCNLSRNIKENYFKQICSDDDLLIIVGVVQIS